ncbi:MAG: hypothetical protein IT537_03165 [Hyphomicrobiales bacterium]|nr:hypothetical protein [Hyphomicrobiales bacterium]
MPANTAIHPPPRPTAQSADDTEALYNDMRALHEWAQKFYEQSVVEAKLLNPAHQADAGTFDESNLPDPTDSSIARAQDVANRAYQLAKSLVP